MSTDYQHLSLRREGPVDWLTLDRPEKFNALSVALVDELRDYFFGLCERTETRVVVLRGAGKHFCAGLDIEEGGIGKDGNAPVGRGWGFQSYLADVYLAMRRCPQPIVSLVQGAACGGGFSFVMASDIRIAADNARMNAAYIKLGLSACDMGCSYFLPRLVGLRRAQELMITNRRLTADEALDWGLVTAVHDDENLQAEALKLAEQLAAGPTLAYGAVKSMLVETFTTDFEAQMERESRHISDMMGTRDAQHGIASFIAKQKPVYEGR